MNSVCLRAIALGAILSSSFCAIGQQTAAPDPVRLNVLAHRLLEAAQKTNALTGPEVKPWHMKLDFQLVQGMDYAKPVSGTMEEWYAAEYRWRRTFASSVRNWTGTEWSTSKLERSVAKRGHDQFWDYEMTLRVARPVVDPLYQLSNLKPSDTLTVRRIDTAGMALNCVSFADSATAEHGKKPEWSFPTMCFDKDVHLRLVHSEETSVQFEDIQPFEGRSVARDVKVISNGHLVAEMKVNQLESSSSPDDAELKPPPDAIALPIVVEPGMPRPVSVYEVGGIIPLLPGGTPFRGTLVVPVIIQKDGTVKLKRGAGPGPAQAIFDAAYSAVSKWKFQPYVVDGQIVEADYDVPYNIDGKPFVPSYERNASKAGESVAGGHAD